MYLCPRWDTYQCSSWGILLSNADSYTKKSFVRISEHFSNGMGLGDFLVQNPYPRKIYAQFAEVSLLLMAAPESIMPHLPYPRHNGHESQTRPHKSEESFQANMPLTSS